MDSKGLVKYTCAVAVFGLFSLQASAASILTLSGPVAKDDQVQQTAQSPSIFAGAVPTQPAGFGYEKFPSGGSSMTYDAATGTGAVNWNNNTGTSGPDYTVGQIIDALGGYTAFNIGIDTNTTSANSEVLQLFEVKIDTGSGFVTEFYCGTEIGMGPACGDIAPPTPNSNGTGWSDYLLSTVNLSGYASTDLVQFHTVITGAVDGQEQLFLTAIPVPAAVWLFGSGLLGLIGIARRKRA